jgi:esterase/lipase superfamily enzyme
MADKNDPWFLQQLASCDIHLVTGCGPWEVPGPTYQMSTLLASRGIPHHLDDGGPKGGHERPYWYHQMWEYIASAFEERDGTAEGQLLNSRF